VLRGEGVLEILPEGYGFLRSPDWNYLYGPDDIYVSPSQIKRFDLRTGDTIMARCGAERGGALPRAVEGRGRQRRRAREGQTPRRIRQPAATLPEERIRLERKDGDLSMRVMDILCPIGKGQRGLIVSPPKAGKTILMQKLANSIIENHPEVYLIVLLTTSGRRGDGHGGEREGGGGDLVTFDEPADRHVQVADMVIEKAKRMVEHGKDVVILLDSITRLGARTTCRAAFREDPVRRRGRERAPEAEALLRRRPQHRGRRSLTIIATALIDTGSRMDEVISKSSRVRQHGSHSGPSHRRPPGLPGDRHAAHLDP